MQPKISIITVSYNQGEFLAAAIDSVLDQNYPNLEYIVIDGGSTDGSVETIQSYDDRIDFWISEPDEGQSQALNKGFARATGEIIGWLNSDDTYTPGTFHAVASVFSDPEVQIAMSEEFAFIQRDGIAYSSLTNSFVDHDHLVRFWTSGGMTINQPCVFFRRSLFEKVGGQLDETLDLAMDYDLWLRLTRHAPIKIVPGIWANYRMHNESKSGRGFHHFLPEWKKVSRRYWGKWYIPKCYSYLIEHLLFLIVRASSKQSSPYEPPVFDFNADYRIKAKDPKVSVIITNYNYGRFVGSAIESVLSQDYENIEIIAVDDGSNDDSRAIIDRYQGRIKPVFKNNGGQASAFNAGVAEATGEILCFLDADDTWKPEKISSIIDKYAEAPWGLVCHDLDLIDDKGEALDQQTYCSFYNFRMESGELFEGLVQNAYPWVFSPTSGMSIPAALARRIFPMTEAAWRICADAPLAYAATYLAPVGVIMNTLGGYRIHGGNSIFSQTHERMENLRTSGIVNPLKIGYFLQNHFEELEGDQRLDPRQNYWFFRSWCLITSNHPWKWLPAIFRKNIGFFKDNPLFLSPRRAVFRQLVLDTMMVFAVVLRIPIRHQFFRQKFFNDLKTFDASTKKLVFSQHYPPPET